MRHIPIVTGFRGNTGVTIEAPAGNFGFSGLVPEVEVIDTTGRQTIWEDDYSPGWEARHPTQFFNTPADSEGNQVSIDEGQTLNGFGAIDVTFPIGSFASCRFNQRINLSSILTGEFADGIPEGWLSVDYLFHAGFSSPRGFKTFAAYSKAGEGTDNPPSCNEGWSLRHMLSENAESSSLLTSHMFTYHTAEDRQRDNWLPNSPTTGIIATDTVARIEHYWKINTSAGATDGLLQQRYDVGTASAHATPQTLRQSLTVQMYCNSEANRDTALMSQIAASMFFGGPDSEIWRPLAPSKIRVGRIAVEAPA